MKNLAGIWDFRNKLLFDAFTWLKGQRVSRTAARRRILESVFATHGNRLWGYLQARVADHHQAEDILQEVFMRALASKASFSCETATVAYLFRSARNLTVDLSRRRIVRREVALAQEPVVEDAPKTECTEQVGILNVVLATLSDDERDVLAMKYEGGLTYAQIASVREEPIGTVLARAHRALRKLGRRLRKREGA